MTGWDLPFDASVDDVDLASDCFRILRRTCARFYVQFSYYEDRRNDKRVDYVLAFDGRPHMLGVASTDFALEMRAVSMLQRHRRRKQLPLRLAHWITFSGSEEPLGEQALEAAQIPEEKRDVVVQHLEEYALAWGAWLRREMPAPDYLEAQHSLLTNLALDLGQHARTGMSFPELIEELRVPWRLVDQCLELGRKRNRVKHRGFRREAESYVDEFVMCIYEVTLATTGIDLMPRSVHMLMWEQVGGLPRLEMYDRWGRIKRFTRY